MLCCQKKSETLPTIAATIAPAQRHHATYFASDNLETLVNVRRMIGFSFLGG
jgi:hypothetical protein